MIVVFKKQLMLFVLFFTCNVFSSEYEVSSGIFTYTSDEPGIISRKGDDFVDEDSASIGIHSKVDFSVEEGLSIRNEVYKESFTSLKDVEILGGVANLLGFEFPKNYYSHSSFHLLLSANVNQYKNICEVIVLIDGMNERNFKKLTVYLSSKNAVISENGEYISIQCKVVSK